MEESVVLVLCEPEGGVGGQLLETLEEMPDLVARLFEDESELQQQFSIHDCVCVLVDTDCKRYRKFLDQSLQFDHSSLPPLILLCNEGDSVEGGISASWAGLTDVLYKPLNSALLQKRVSVFFQLHQCRAKVQRCQQELEAKSLEIEVLNQELLEKNYRLELLSSLDTLTGLFNRYYFDENLQKEWRQAVRRDEPLSLLFINVDLLKLYNEHYGHEEGDELLRELAGVLHGTLLRPVDIVARYGGDQFAAILPGTGGAGAELVASRILENVAGLQRDHIKAPGLGHVTVSIGGATMRPKTSDKLTGLVGKAESALQEAKSAGRNRVLHDK